MIKSLKNFLNKPFPYYIPFSRSFKLILWFSIGFPIFYLLVQPFGVINWECEHKTALLLGLALPLFIGLNFNFYLITALFPKPFKEENWTIGREILWSIWNIVSIVLLVNIYFRLLPACGVEPTSLTNTLSYGILVGLLPSLICVQYNQLQFARRQLKKLEQLNNLLSERQGIIDNETINLKGQNEDIELVLNDLLFVEAQDNYINIVWQNKSGLQQRLIRGKLKDIEDQLNFEFIKKCHRSYIVNLSNVKSVSGTSKGYKLNLKQGQKQVPVSRDQSQEIILFLEKSRKLNYSR